ncbi:MAG: DUF4956 domain-containing protein [Pseudomonadota bacterium]
MSDSSMTNAGAGAHIPPRANAPSRQAGYRLLRRLVIYHVALAAILGVMLALVPGIVDYMPVGGVGDLAAGVGARVTQVDDRMLAAEVAGNAAGAARTPDLDRLGYARRLAIALVGVWLLMLPVSWVHKGIYRSSGFDHSIDETTLILPGVVAAIVLVVQYNLALAFALAGIVAGVRFRRSLQDTFDALFILAAIGAGIAAGVSALEVVAVMTVFFCYATVYVVCFGDGLQSDFVAERKVRKGQRKADEAESRAAAGHGGRNRSAGRTGDGPGA